MRVRGKRGTNATRRTRDRRILLVVAHGRQTATALAELTAGASTPASSIVDLQWEAGSEVFTLIMSLSVRGGPVVLARTKAALRAAAERQHVTIHVYPMSDLGGTG